MIKELVARVFAARNAAHLAHWNAKGKGSYARHVALGDFYDGVIDKIDGIVETYQGNFGLIGDVDLQPGDNLDILKVLERDAGWLDQNRSKIAEGVRALENMVDDLAALYLSTIYKLRNLE